MRSVPQSAPSARNALAYRPDIDGLRALAIAAVVAYHCGLPWASGGFVGVDVFFVLSGFLIGTQVINDLRDGTFSLLRFYTRRARRILPALFAVLCFCTAAALVLLSPLELTQYASSALAVLASSSNFLFAERGLSYFDSDILKQPLMMTWTLSVEEQFYLLFPVSMLLLRNLRPRLLFVLIAGLTVISLAFAIRYTLFMPGLVFYLLPARAWELSAGVLLALYKSTLAARTEATQPMRAHGIGLLGVACIAVAIALFTRATPFPSYRAMLPVTGTVLLLSSSRGLVAHVLSLRPVVFVGRLSYSWYLWHWPILSFAHIIVYRTDALTPGMNLMLCGLSFGIAVASFYFVEQPFRRATSSGWSLLAGYGAVAAALAVISIWIYGTRGLPQRNHAAEQLDRTRELLHDDPCIFFGPVPASSLRQSRCSPPGRQRAVALVGDSHAAMLADGLRAIAHNSEYRLIELSKPDCPPALGVATFYSDARNSSVPECIQFNQEVLDYIKQAPDVQVVVVAGFWSKPIQYSNEYSGYVAGASDKPLSRAYSFSLIEEGLDAWISQLEASGKDVYLIEETPTLPFDPARALFARSFTMRGRLNNLLDKRSTQIVGEFAPEIESQEVAATRAMLARIAAAHPRVRLIDLHDNLCHGHNCQFSDGGQALFADGDHLTSLGAQRALANLRLP